MLIFKLRWAKFNEQGLFMFTLVNSLIQEMIEKNYGKNGKIFKYNSEIVNPIKNI
jgi:D-lyxose ketol-isomerase